MYLLIIVVVIHFNAIFNIFGIQATRNMWKLYFGINELFAPYLDFVLNNFQSFIILFEFSNLASWESGNRVAIILKIFVICLSKYWMNMIFFYFILILIRDVITLLKEKNEIESEASKKQLSSLSVTYFSVNNKLRLNKKNLICNCF